MNQQLIGFTDLIQKTINQFKDAENFKYYLKTIIVVILITFALITPLIIVVAVVAASLGSIYSGATPVDQNFPAILVILLMVLVFFPLLGYVSGLCNAVITKMTLDIAEGSIRPVKELLKFGYSKAWRLFAVSFVMALAVVGGLIFLIIPGLVIAILLQFGSWVAVQDDRGVGYSLKTSYNLVKGHFWAVLGYGLAYSITAIILTALLAGLPLLLDLKLISEVLRVVLNVLTNMFSLLFYTNLYLALRETSGAPAGSGTKTVSPDEGEDVAEIHTQIGASGRAAYLTTHAPVNYEVVQDSDGKEDVLPPNKLNTIPDPD